MRVIVSFLFVLLIFLQAQLWFGSHGVFQLWSLQRSSDELSLSNSKLILRNEELHAEVQELRQGKEALEERARSHLGFIKEGEVFYRIITPKEDVAE
ncbi:MAG: cell division protein FtsB [Gammaproteobacteria bacterium]|nr:cell division protein FtsB [Gammaproteobacteria bacterium]